MPPALTSPLSDISLMYLADSLRLAQHSSLPREAGRCKSLAGFTDAVLVPDTEIYAFTQSSLAMASELDIWSIERLKSIIEMVSARPGRRFFEIKTADYSSHLSILSRKGGVTYETSPASRTGILCDVHDDGAIHITSVTYIRKKLKTKLKKNASPKARLEWDATSARISCLVSPYTLVFDPSGWQFEPFSSWKDKDHDEVELSWIDYCRDVLGKDAPAKRMAHAIISFITHAGIMVNSTASEQMINDMIVMQGMDAEELLRQSQNNLIDAFLASLGMSAVLDARSDYVEMTARAAAPAKRANPMSQSQIARDRLSVITVNLQDDELERGVIQASEERGDRKSPIRHFVRGHLFLARDGKITYRRPSWRGERRADPVITRVR